MEQRVPINPCVHSLKLTLFWIIIIQLFAVQAFKFCCLNCLMQPVQDDTIKNQKLSKVWVNLA